MNDKMTASRRINLRLTPTDRLTIDRIIEIMPSTFSDVIRFAIHIAFVLVQSVKEDGLRLVLRNGAAQTQEDLDVTPAIASTLRRGRTRSSLTRQQEPSSGDILQVRLTRHAYNQLTVLLEVGFAVNRTAATRRALELLYRIVVKTRDGSRFGSLSKAGDFTPIPILDLVYSGRQEPRWPLHAHPKSESSHLSAHSATVAAGRRGEGLRVFISSTHDLVEESRAVIQAIRAIGGEPISNRPSSEPRTLQATADAIGAAHLHILILGHRYGDQAPEQPIGYPELEYDLALRLNVESHVFLLQDEVFFKRRMDLDNNYDSEEIENIDRLLNFRGRLQERPWHVYEGVSTLLAEVERLLQEHIRSQARISAPEPSSPWSAIKEHLHRLESVFVRSPEEPAKKEAMARVFAEQYLERLEARGGGIFLESGSTIGYVAQAISRHFTSTVKVRNYREPNIQFSTSDSIAHILLSLTGSVPCIRLQWNQFTDPSAGECDLEHEPDMLAVLPSLFEPFGPAIDPLLTEPNPFAWMRRPGLLLSAASGLQLGARHNITVGGCLNTVDVLRRHRIDKCFGPHVGSFENVLFKRWMYSTDMPVLVFVTGDKIDREIEVGKRHFVFDSELPWEVFCRERPVAFCVGGTRDEVEKHGRQFEALGFELRMQDTTTETIAFIARNRRFVEAFEEAPPLIKSRFALTEK